MRKIFLMVLMTLAGQNLLLGQTNQKIEDDITVSYGKILYWKFDSDANDTTINAYDSLELQNELFRNKLLQYTSNHPATLTYGFNLLKEKLDIATSPDKKFRIYSWDTWTGGTMHFFDNVYQYNASGKIKSMTSGQDGDSDPKSTFYKLFQVKSARQTIYMAAYTAVYSGRDIAGGVKLFTIDKKGLNDSVKLFRTNTGLHNTIDYYFDMMKMDEGIEMPEVKWDAANKTLFIPLINENDKSTGKFIRYRFDGFFFKRIK